MTTLIKGISVVVFHSTFYTLRLMVFLLAGALFPLSTFGANTTFTFTLPAEYMTSAGAYDSSGFLMRTLWRSVPYKAGTYTVAWDGNDDMGDAVPPGTYTIKVLYHNMNYAWEGVIGNTGSSFTDHINVSLGDPTCMAFDGTNAFLANGYSEGHPWIKRFNTSTPDTMTGALPPDRAVYLSYVTTDGTRFYVADTGSALDTTNSTFVTSYNVSDNSPATFATGSPITLSTGSVFNSCIDVDQTDRVMNASNSLTVQKYGSVLAVAHGNLDLVKLFDKNTGISMGSISISNPISVAFAPNGDLWVVSGTTAQRYTNVGTANTLVTTISGFAEPLAIAVNPTNNDIVLVADGGTQQKIKAYNSTGTSLWSLGTTGGYATNGPAVSPAKFQFESDRPLPLAVQSDGSFWVRDNGTNRLLHYNSARGYLNQISCVRGYVATVDLNDPTRVFGGGWLEYQVDYTRPLLPGDPKATGGNSSWKMVKNWTPVSMPQYIDDFSGGLATVVTLSNGRTYGLCLNTSTKKLDLVELTATGLRVTGLSFTTKYSLYANGDLRNYNHPAGGIQTVSNQPLTGFDGAGNPVWGSPTVLATVTGDVLSPAFVAGTAVGPKFAQFPITDSNILVSYNANHLPTYAGMHLGGVQLSSPTDWAWEASPAVMTDAPMDGLGSFDVGDAITYAGNIAQASGRNIVCGFHGEFWKGKEACQNMHFYDDGLFVGQFGTSGDLGTYTTTPPTTTMQLVETGRPGGAGNAFSPTLTMNGTECYYYSNDENTHGGVHRWHLLGFNAIQEMSGTAVLGGTTTLSTTPPGFPYGVVATPGNGQVVLNWQPVPGASSYRVRYGTQCGAPFTGSIGGIFSTTRTIPGLTNDTPYYFTVYAVIGGVESASSYTVLVTPIDTTIAVHQDGQAIFSVGSKVRTITVTSANVGNGQYPVTLHNMFSSIGLRKLNLGSNGYALYNWDGVGTNAVKVATGFGITLGSGWTTYNSLVNVNFILDGVTGPQACIHTKSTGSINITVGDTNWHTLSVVSPPWGGYERNDVFTLTPQGAGSPVAVYTNIEPFAFSYIHLMQFKFKGNVTLTVDQLADPYPKSANISGIFID